MMTMMVGSSMIWMKFCLKRSTYILLEMVQLDSAQKNISNAMWKYANGVLDQELFLVKVEVPQS